MTAKIYRLNEYKNLKTIHKDQLPETLDETRLVIELVKNILIQAGYSPNESLSILLPLVLPPGHSLLGVWAYTAKTLFSDQLKKRSDCFQGL